MSDIPSDLHYTEEHEYLKVVDGDGVYAVGVTDYAQGELGDVVFVELPDVGSHFDKMDVFGTIEAVKAVSELFSPASGEVMEVNGAIDADPAVVNTDPYGDGWMVRIRLSAPSELDALLNSEAYSQHIGE